MTNESPRPSIATVFDPALQISSVDRTSQIMYCPDKQVLAWFVTTPCAMHPDGERRIVDARGWQCTSCGRYLGEWMFTKADFDGCFDEDFVPFTLTRESAACTANNSLGLLCSGSLPTTITIRPNV